VSDPFQPTLVGTLAAALPPDGANPLGRSARAVLVNKMKGATPGHFPVSFGQGQAYKGYFFANYVYNPEEAQVNPYTGLTDAFWSDMAVAALCQQMYHVTSNIRQRILIDKINGNLGAWNADLRGRVARFYAHMARVVDGNIKTALAAFPDEHARKQAREYYMLGLTSDSWINAKVTQQASGNWTNQDWELFHHWIKLAALGASDQEIDDVINRASAKGLPVPSSLAAGAWRTWSVWFGNNIGSGDVGEATEPIVRTRCKMIGLAIDCMSEANSYDFTANGQPGTAYRVTPSGGSCFAPGAKVLMADGTLKNIETIAPGEQVKTPDGTREVLLRAAPLRGARPLYRIGETAFAFTATHPFIIYDGRPETVGVYTAVNPEALARALPMLAQLGIRPMSGDPPPPLVACAAGTVEPYRPENIRLDPNLKPDSLFDLILDVDLGGRSEYFVGDETIQLLVSSEVPRYLDVPATTAVVIEVMQNCAGTILAELSRVPDEGFADLLTIGYEAISRTLLPSIGSDLNAPAQAEEFDPERFLDRERVRGDVRAFAASLSSEGSGYDHRLGTVLDLFVPQFAPQFQAAIGLGWRTFELSDLDGGMLLAVTLYGLELFGCEGTIPADEAALALTLSIGDARYLKVAPVLPSNSTDHSYYATDQVIYFSEWRAIIEPSRVAEGEPNWRLTVSLQSSDGKTNAPFAATLNLPWKITGGYQYFQLPVFDPDGKTCGRAMLDIRTLTTSGFVNDLNERANWQQSGEAVVAHNLARLTSTYINDNFGTVIKVFQKSAATPDAQGASLSHGA
jgi:hypothetical protein